jgi:hypothetical protein
VQESNLRMYNAWMAGLLATANNIRIPPPPQLNNNPTQPGNGNVVFGNLGLTYKGEESDD